MVGQFLFGQFGPRVQPMLDNGFGQGVNNDSRGGVVRGQGHGNYPKQSV
jgi:hypothetical protein